MKVLSNLENARQGAAYFTYKTHGEVKGKGEEHESSKY